MRSRRASPTIHGVLEQVIYREEVLTIMGLLGDVRDELKRIREAPAEDDGEEEEEADA